MAGYERYEEQLTAEYFHTFKEIEAFFKASELSDSEMEDVMNDILDLFLMAQYEGKSLKKVIGSDTESFCRNYKKGMWKFPSIKKVLMYSGEWLGAVFICIAVSLFIDYFDGRIQDLWRDKSDITSMIVFFIPLVIGNFIDKCIVRKKVFKNCISRENHVERKGWIAVIILILLLELVCDKLDIILYVSLGQTVFILVITAVIVLIGYAVIRLAYRFLGGYLMKKKRY